MTFGLVWKVMGGVALLLILGAAAAITYFNHTRPQALGLSSATARTPAPSPLPGDPLDAVCRRPSVPGNSTSTGVGGLWVIQPHSAAGYRAHEKFAEVTSPHDAVARTERMSGWLLVGGSDTGPELLTGCIAVDVRTLRSIDELPGFNTSDRDDIARDFLTARSHPYVVFQPYPMPLRVNASSDAVQHVTLAGDLEIASVTKPASFKLDVRLKDGQVTAAGQATVHVDDYGIQVPQEAGGFVSVNPDIVLEVSLILLKP
jgi:hypothetical protein